MIILDGISYDIPIVNVIRTADFLDKYAERTEDGVLHRELIGVYFNYRLQFGQITNVFDYAAFWNKLTEAVEFHTVTVPGENGDYTFIVYFASISDELRKTKAGISFWKNLTVNFIAKEPAEIP
jgi:hypothetical protein